jgi:hypothetical protein
MKPLRRYARKCKRPPKRDYYASDSLGSRGESNTVNTTAERDIAAPANWGEGDDVVVEARPERNTMNTIADRDVAAPDEFEEDDGVDEVANVASGARGIRNTDVGEDGVAMASAAAVTDTADDAEESERTVYRCDFCPRNFSSYATALLHEGSCRSRLVDNARGSGARIQMRTVYRCNFCPRIFFLYAEALLHESSCQTVTDTADDTDNAGEIAGNARGSENVSIGSTAQTAMASAAAAVTDMEDDAVESENALIGSTVTDMADDAVESENALIGSTAQTAVTDMADDAVESENVLIGSSAQTAIPVIDRIRFKYLPRASYNDIDTLPVYKMKWNAFDNKSPIFVGNNKGTEVRVRYDDICTMCQEGLEGKLICALPKCKHVFCYECIAEWLLQNASCPQCRSALKTK